MSLEGDSQRQKVLTSSRAMERFSAEEPCSRIIIFPLMLLNILAEGHQKAGEKSENLTTDSRKVSLKVRLTLQ